MNRYAYFDDATLVHRPDEDAQKLVAFMREVWPSFWKGYKPPSGVFIKKDIKKYFAGLQFDKDVRHAREIKAIILGTAFKGLKPIENEPNVSEADRTRFRCEKYSFDRGDGRCIERGMLGWAQIRRSVALGFQLAGELDDSPRCTVIITDRDGNKREMRVWCLAKASHFDDPAVARWLWCLHREPCIYPHSVDRERQKHFELRNWDPPPTANWETEPWVGETKRGHSQFRPGVDWNDCWIIQIFHEAFDAAYSEGRFEAKGVAGLFEGQDKFVWDSGALGPVGASGGKPTSCVEIYVSDTPSEEVHVRPK